MFLGYPGGVKGYRVWLIEDKNVVISKDVVFNEEVMYKNITEENQNEEGSAPEPEVNVISTPVVTAENVSTDQGGATEQSNTPQDNVFPEQKQGFESETDS